MSEKSETLPADPIASIIAATIGPFLSSRDCALEIAEKAAEALRAAGVVPWKDAPERASNADSDVPRAHSLEVAGCEHGAIHLFLLDAAGGRIATASMSASVANDFVGQILTEIKSVVERAIGEPMGHA